MRRLAVCALVAGLGLAACGPVESTIMINDAEVAIEAARLVESEEYSPFEYVSAVEYLHKAKEKRNYSEFEPAIDYALKAERFAEEAKKNALESPDRGKAGGTGAGVDSAFDNGDLLD